MGQCGMRKEGGEVDTGRGMLVKRRKYDLTVMLRRPYFPLNNTEI